MIRLRPKTSVRTSLLVGLVLGLIASLGQFAYAVQIKDVGDGATIYARISEKELTRLSVSPGRIASLRVKQGELQIDADDDTGQVFLSVPAGSKKAVNGFLTTDTGSTYTLILEIADIPADSIIINQPQSKASAAITSRSSWKTTPYEKLAKRLISQMANDEHPGDVLVRPVEQKLALWREATMTLETQYIAGNLIGERYVITNLSDASMEMDEREFYRKGVSAIALEQHTLPLGTSTRLYVVREKQAND